MKRSTFITLIISLGLAAMGLIPQHCQKPITSDRPWVEESEFQGNPWLHATSDQVIIFDLEPRKSSAKTVEGKHANRLIRDTAAYLVRDDDPELFSFCIAEDEPYLQTVELESLAGETVWRHQVGDACVPAAIRAGRYRLHLLHDPTGIGSTVVKAFLHRPQSARLMGNSLTDYGAPNFMAFKGPQGQYVTSDVDDAPLLSVQARATTVGAHEVWRLGSSYPYSITDGNGQVIKDNLQITAQFVGSSGETGDYPASYNIDDKGNGQFTLKLGEVLIAPINVRNAGQGAAIQQLFRSSTNYATFTVDYKGFDCETCDESTLPLQEGEVALFAGCNYTGPGIVFHADVPDFSFYDAAAAIGLGIGDDMTASVRLGPNTFAILYQQAQYTGLVAGIQTDTACLDSTVLGSNEASSLQITTDVAQFTIASNTCVDCDLTGADLSDVDFTAGKFTGTIFSSANLTNTIFRSATLDHASFSGNATNLSGTSFANAILDCTDMSETNLSTAVFDDDPIIIKDFSCRLDLSGATLHVDALPFDAWRYLDLTGADIRDGEGATLSTLAAPLDLSGARLSGATGLNGTLLDGANLDCAAVAGGQQLCTQLIGTNLSQASLEKADLTNAAMNGANLSFANLSAANLEGAQLLKGPNSQTSATLEGAYLKNANLSGADLSGANLSNANWYSTVITTSGCPGSAWTGNCASGDGATFNSTNFEGAYLSGVDLSGSTPQGANFGGAVLIGANLTSANLSNDPDTGVATSFSGAFIQGTDFTDTIVTDANFISAYVDQDGSGSRLFQLPETNLQFTGYSPSTGAIAGCVEASYPAPTTVPETASDNICPNDTNGACSDEQWQDPTIGIDEAPPPSTADTATGLPSGCNSGTIDFSWILQ